MDSERTVFGALCNYSHGQCFTGEGQGAGAQSAHSRETWAGLGAGEAGWMQGPDGQHREVYPDFELSPNNNWR